MIIYIFISFYSSMIIFGKIMTMQQESIYTGYY